MFQKIKKISDWSIANPKRAIKLNVVLAAVLLFLVALPFIVPGIPLSKLRVDTDPENMLSKTEEVRVFHNQMRKEFHLYDIVVVGVVDKTHSQGVFNVDSLKGVYALTEYAKTLDGVVTRELMAPSTVDSIESGAQGVVNFHWLMPESPATDKESKAIYDQAKRIPFLNGTLVSEDGKALALYVPIKSKDLSYAISKALKEKAKELEISDQVFIAGLPVAQDQFGVEMFKQMLVSAPLAMLFIFLLMYFFFRNVRLIASPMIVAGLSVVVTMGLLVVTGNTVHIMSSMIPIFIMPIAVLDAVHILSDFFDVYPKFKDRKKAINHVMSTLSMPMLYTSITTVVGFASLAFTPIPPVQVFGVFVALGVGFAWLSTITFIPAFIMLMSQKSLDGFGLKEKEPGENRLGKGLQLLGFKMRDYAKPVLGIALVGVLVSFVGISKIQINDNPVKWFSKSHDIRIADKELNDRFAGTYMAYLALEKKTLVSDLKSKGEKVGFPPEIIGQLSAEDETVSDVLENMRDYADVQDNADLWHQKIDMIESDLQVFKNPEMLHYIEGLQSHLQTVGVVGKSSSIVDIIKTVHRDLYLGQEKDFRLPDTSAAIAQTLMTYQNSHRPNDLWHFVTPDYTKATLFVQLNSGDNKDMASLVKAVADYQSKYPAPFKITSKWFGMTYINVVWQDKMVSGMMQSFLGSFLIVLLLMTLLFRSIGWGMLAMLPLVITISGIYGLIGFVGKDYDMPIAVLSSLSLGLAVDYAIHFLARARVLRGKNKTWDATIKPLFGDPAQAIFRNVIVISIGFVPLLFATLVPYQTVGLFISAILFFAGAVTLLILPALITLFQKVLFKNGLNHNMTRVTKISVVVLIGLIIIENVLF
ncbi:MAG: MMPL family transporter [Alphaproteobacteria bacterium]|nr:MMPL family transporter [Alphaproteobacteria bacterium]